MKFLVITNPSWSAVERCWHLTMPELLPKTVCGHDADWLGPGPWLVSDSQKAQCQSCLRTKLGQTYTAQLAQAESRYREFIA